ncbi:unnamed protein product [Vicia faba]|uniref:Uncharacterized protein n=1 Tax=Vicia faba TaxID=3906 RepID=A0AAV1A4Z4_VICFA|nr:unnamed protein product [Vicia faba]
MPLSISTLFFFFFLLFNLQPSTSQQQFKSFNTSLSPWLPSQNKTLTSPNSNFTAGFFPIPNSPNLFTFSIWFSKIPHSSDPIIWSISTKLNSSSSLIITQKGLENLFFMMMEI